MGMEISELAASAGCKVPLTTFVKTDTNTFREVVQRLTAGSPPSDPAEQVLQVKMKATNTNPTTADISGAVNSTRKMKSSSSFSTTSKLHDRRQSMKMRPKLEIVKPTTTTFHSKPSSASSSPRPLLLSPCTIFSKLSILQQEQAEEENKLGATSQHHHHHHQILLMNTQEEEKAIQGRRFYLHPSPRGGKPPELLTLFPLTSPKSSQMQ